jgi:hypothetical protein
VETAADRRRQRHERRQKDAMKNGVVVGESSTAQEADQEAYEVTQDQIVVPQKESPVLTNRPIPVESLMLNKQTAVELERSISGKSSQIILLPYCIVSIVSRLCETSFLHFIFIFYFFKN